MIVPLNRNVVLKKESIENKTDSGIILSTKDKELPSIAIVSAVSPKCDAELRVGAKVVFKQYSGNEVELDGEKYVIVDEDDILGIIE